MKGVFLDITSLDRGDLDLNNLRKVLTDWQFYSHTGAEVLNYRLRDAEVVIVNKVILDASALKCATKLKLICIAATGTNNVDLQAASNQGVVVTNIQGYANNSVAQHVFALILCLYRNLNQYQNAITRGDWHRSSIFCLLDYPIMDLQGKTLGIIGYGELGKSVAKLAECLGMKICIAKYHDTDVGKQYVELDEVIRTSDILSLHCPLTDKTRNLIDEGELQQMKQSALLINTARGGIVNEAALAKALQQGWIAGAGIDVLETEPPDGSSPLMSDLKNLVLTPHIAWASQDARQKIVDQLFSIISAYKKDEVINQVNK